MVRRAVPALLTLALAGSVAAGCGSGSGSGDAGSGPLAARSPDQVLTAVAGALRGVRSYRVQTSYVDADGPTRINAAVREDGSTRATYVSASSTVSFVVTGGRGYVRGDLGYWRDPDGGGLGERAARVLAGEWVVVPGRRLVEEVRRLVPDELAHCLPHRVGTLSLGGRRTVGGRPVVVLRDAGDVGGGAPSELWIATDGPPLPLRERQTGPARPGGAFDPRCDDRDDTTRRSDTTISYAPVPPIAPPPGAIDPSQLGRPQPAQPPAGTLIS